MMSKVYAKPVASNIDRHNSHFKISRPTISERQYFADTVIFLRYTPYNLSNELIFDLIKDRDGGLTGPLDLETAIKVCASMLSKFKFQGSNKLFQTNVTLTLEEVMKNVLLGNNQIPTQETIKEYLKEGNKK